MQCLIGEISSSKQTETGQSDGNSGLIVGGKAVRTAIAALGKTRHCHTNASQSKRRPQKGKDSRRSLDRKAGSTLHKGSLPTNCCRSALLRTKELLMKITIVGTGKVGSAIAFASVMNPMASELMLVNRSRDKAEGDALDLRHASALRNSNMQINAGDIGDTAGSDVIVFTASVPTVDPTKQRTALAEGNYHLLSDWIPKLAAVSPNATLIMVTNPVDALTYVSIELSGFPPSRVIGTGTLLDSIRYRSMLSEELEIHSDDIRAYILGEHGDTQFAARSIAMTGGERFYSNDVTERIFHETVGMGYRVAKMKGYTNYGVAMATMLILDSIAYDLRHTMPLSVLIEDFCGVKDVCLSLPAVVGRDGVTRVIRPQLTEAEEAAFCRSAETVRETVRSMNR